MQLLHYIEFTSYFEKRLKFLLLLLFFIEFIFLVDGIAKGGGLKRCKFFCFEMELGRELAGSD